MTLQHVAGFDAAAYVPEQPLTATDQCEDWSHLFPSTATLRKFAAKAALEERKKETDESCNALRISSASQSDSAQSEIWGETRNNRRFERTSNGCAQYEFRPAETLRSVVTDLLIECRKSGSNVGLDYQSLRSAMNAIATHNNISDPDCIDAGSKLTIPAAFVPTKKSAA